MGICRIALSIGNIRFIYIVCVGIFFVGAILYYISSPKYLSEDILASVSAKNVVAGNVVAGDVVAGEKIFHAGGCASCHGSALLGGEKFITAFGTFYAPNITPHQTSGIGGWSVENFANAMLQGVSPGGEHYYPAFPYTSYANMELIDVINLFAYLKTFSKQKSAVPKNEVPFPFSQRRLIGLWKFLYFKNSPLPILPNETLQRGQYLVRVLGHCGECHTPRNFAGAMKQGHFLLGSKIAPDITNGKNGIGEWSMQEIEYSFQTGFLPNYDTFGESMALVQENLAKLSPEDRRAIALYLSQVSPP